MLHVAILLILNIALLIYSTVVDFFNTSFN